MRFVLTRDGAEFAARARPFLEPRIECNLLVTVLDSVLGSSGSEPGPVFAYGLDGAGAVQFGSLRAPPWFMLASELTVADAPRLIAAWLEVDPGLPGVDSVPGTARAIAAAFANHTGRSTRVSLQEGMHALSEVRDPPRPAPGELRVAVDEDRGRMIDWMGAFTREAGLLGADQAETLVDRRMSSEALLVWDHGGPVSMVGSAGPVAGVARIGPVYTPPELRRRGYAGTAVAAVSRRALERGAHTCTLFTDLTNPTSNKIYAEIGYRRIGDWEQHSFDVTG